MRRLGRRPALGLLLLLVLGGSVLAGAEPGSPETLSWRALIPPGWNAMGYAGPFLMLSGRDDLEDDDPRAQAALAELLESSKQVPTVPGLQGRPIRLPGFVSALTTTPEGDVTEFLLVPYQGGCIHRPPPPSNQVVHVKPAVRLPPAMAAQAVWVAGTIEVVRTDFPHAVAGYLIRAGEVGPFDWDQDRRYLRFSWLRMLTDFRNR
jgi:hypothetical protein